MDRSVVARRRALTISRGRFASTELLFLRVAHEGIEGLGEAAAIDHGPRVQTAATAEAELSMLARELRDLSPGSISLIEETARSRGLGSAALAALDMACWDWLAKRAELPLFALLGLEPGGNRTSVTVGIEKPEEVASLIRDVLARTGARVLKLKLGGPEGIEGDKARYLAARESAPDTTPIRVDANGGWSAEEAVEMFSWLADRDCEYVEQPLSANAPHEDLVYVHSRRRIPNILDEPIFDSRDVARLADCCDGINLKLMKCGGISEAIRAIHTARAHGLSTMLGCFGESSVAISAAASLGSLLDWLDLDSHLNMEPDPALGVSLVDGRLIPPDRPGHGASLSKDDRP